MIKPNFIFQFVRYMIPNDGGFEPQEMKPRLFVKAW